MLTIIYLGVLSSPAVSVASSSTLSERTIGSIVHSSTMSVDAMALVVPHLHLTPTQHASTFSQASIVMNMPDADDADARVKAGSHDSTASSFADAASVSVESIPDASGATNADRTNLKPVGCFNKFNDCYQVRRQGDRMTYWSARAHYMCIVLWMSLSQHATLRALLASVAVRTFVAA